jgi:Ca2+-binding EF-hand superfamily protein
LYKYLKYPVSEQISAAFAKFDETGNGKLNYVEFCGMMNRSKNREKDKDKGGGGGKTLASGSSSGAPR